MNIIIYVRLITDLDVSRLTINCHIRLLIGVFNNQRSLLAPLNITFVTNKTFDKQNAYLVGRAGLVFE